MTHFDARRPSVDSRGPGVPNSQALPPERVEARQQAIQVPQQSGSLGPQSPVAPVNGPQRHRQQPPPNAQVYQQPAPPRAQRSAVSAGDVARAQGAGGRFPGAGLADVLDKQSVDRLPVSYAAVESAGANATTRMIGYILAAAACVLAVSAVSSLLTMFAAICAAAAVVVVSGPPRGEALWAWALSGVGVVVVAFGAFVIEPAWYRQGWLSPVLLIGASFFGLGWALARSRAPIVAGLCWLGVLVLAVPAAYILRSLYIAGATGASLLCGIVPVAIAWAASFSVVLERRSPRQQNPARTHPAGPPVRAIVGYTADGQAVYGNMMVSQSASPSTGPNGLAIASFVCSLGMLSIVAVILGHMSRAQSQREGQIPHGLALAGVILGYIGLAGQLVWVIMYLLFLGVIG